jgi:hypothetical protein
MTSDETRRRETRETTRGADMASERRETQDVTRDARRDETTRQDTAGHDETTRQRGLGWADPIR